MTALRSGPIAAADDAAPPQAPLRATLALARPVAGRLAVAALLGAGAIGGGIGLIATSAWLISRASQRPEESSLAIAIVAVQFFGLSRGLFRYAQRLVGHDAAFRALADLRVTTYARLETLAPAGLDGHTELEIVRSIDRLARGRTVLLVAHRPALVAMADRVVSLVPVEVAA